MRIVVTCPACDGEQSADLWLDIGAFYGERFEELASIDWEPPEGPYACFCERDGTAEQRLIDAANEDTRY